MSENGILRSAGRYALLCLLLVVFTGSDQGSVIAGNAVGTPSVSIQKRKVVIFRKGKFVRDFPDRRTAVIYYPVVGGPQNSEVLRKVRAILNVKNVFDSSIAEYRQDTWLSEFDYKINYNRNYILDITFTQTGVGAYPDTNTKHFAINLKSGELIKAADAFTPDAVDPLVSMLDKKLQAEVQQTLKDHPEEKENAESLFGEVKYKPSDLDEFSISNKGITFMYDAGFPHAVQALEPNGSYFLSYAQMKQYIRRNGPLGVFVP